MGQRGGRGLVAPPAPIALASQPRWAQPGMQPDDRQRCVCGTALAECVHEGGAVIPPHDSAAGCHCTKYLVCIDR